ncbi:hypothetical protein ETAA8_36120 [Anatilimnocola aggregata]|uniref:Uncharacterized protein n=1 Tax=Anatilimnocola aggregata TaxID=2528021 RepID=A0A517YE65_9BACT|nr:hypothetical protein [Anatilimnocola aggregata]QDU28510.1 hypothetical protein ETAA8_36120 [Anatilimnocola aggregata]
MEIELSQSVHVKSPTCQNIDWYSEGETRVVRFDGVEMRIRFIGRKGRRGRILVEAPAGAVFQTVILNSDTMKVE